jgi:hypothetical protein
MSFAMASLLAHSDSVPATARVVLQAAHEGPASLRVGLLESAAEILHRETGLGCADARELMDLAPRGCAD